MKKRIENETNSAAAKASRFAFLALGLWGRGMSWVIPAANVFFGSIA